MKCLVMVYVYLSVSLENQNVCGNSESLLVE